MQAKEVGSNKLASKPFFLDRDRRRSVLFSTEYGESAILSVWADIHTNGLGSNQKVISVIPKGLIRVIIAQTMELRGWYIRSRWRKIVAQI